MAEQVYKIGAGNSETPKTTNIEITPGYINADPWGDAATLEPFWRALRDNEYSWQGRFFIASGEPFQAKVESLDEKRSRIANGFGIIAVGKVMDILGTVQHMAEGGYDEEATVLVPDATSFQLPRLRGGYELEGPIAQTFYDESGKATRCIMENGDIYVDEGEGGLWMVYEGHSGLYYSNPHDPTGSRI